MQRKKIEDVDNKIPEVSCLVSATVLDTKDREVDKKVPNISGLVRKIDYDSKNQKLREVTLLLLTVIYLRKTYKDKTKIIIQ